MTRGKVNIAYIASNSERRASFRKRKKGLIKKVSELATLCDVQACAIIYSEYDPEPPVWPSRPEAQAVLARFNKLLDQEKSRYMVNQESLTLLRIKKVEKQICRVRAENKRKQLEIFMSQCLAGKASLENFDLRDTAEMRRVINQTFMDIDSRMEALQIDDAVEAAAARPSMVEVVPHPRCPGELAAARRGEENMESFAWNLVESPTGGGGGGGLGWDNGMVLPYPYIFDQANSATSRAEPGPGSN